MAVELNRVRFGVFEVDRGARELRKHGVRIKLEDQPFELLTALLEKPGDLVTRSELQARLWPPGTFVDFDKSLTKAVNKVRQALGDSPVNPRFVETLSGRGYRFIAPVDDIAKPKPGLGPDGAAPAQADRLRRGASPKGWWIVAVVSCSVVAIAAVGFAFNVGSLRDRLLTTIDRKSTAHLPGIDSIAVLPLENLSRDPEQEYFADGLTDELITDLGKMITLRVISRTSVMQYKRTKKALPEIARELNVDAAVEGTVQRSGGRVRVTAQLLQARTDRHLWAETYERDSADVIQLERQMAVAIAHEVTGRLSPAQETRFARGGTVNPRAYDAYLRGRYFWGQRIPEPTRAAIGYFEQALREDPNFALAYSGLADCYGVSWWLKDFPLAEKYARQALAVDPDLAEAYASLGIIDTSRHRFADAEKELRRALDLNPNYLMAHHWQSARLLWLGRPEEALAENERARQLDPFSFPVNHLRVYVLLGLRQYGRALEQAETEATIAPQSAYSHFQMARIYWIEGRVPDALAEERNAAALAHLLARPRDQDAVVAAFARSGLRAAQVRSAQLKEKGYKGAYPALQIAYQYGLIGGKGKVLEWLNQAFRDSGEDEGWALTAPEFDCVRSTARFHDLFRQLER